MNFDQITKWYTGKALATIKSYVIPTLMQAAIDGYWQKGDARKVRAALNKQAVAHKFAKANDRDLNCRDYASHVGRLHDVKDVRGELWFESELRGSEFIHAMLFGAFTHAPDLCTLGAALETFCANDAERAALTTAREWADNFYAVALLINKLDATRPKPTVVMGSLSPTVASNLGSNLGIKFDSIASPPVKWTWVERVIKGQTVRVPVGEILWPEGTQHNKSRFAFGTARHDQCHACGHAIKNGFNWVPLVAQTAESPVSLWVGRDCAQKLFAVDVTGDAEYSNR